MKAAKDPKSIYRGPQWSPEHRWIGCLGSPSTSPYSEYKMGLLALNCANMDEPAVAPPGPLSFLSIAMRELEQADLDILGRLPALRYLDLEVDHEDLGILGGFVVSAGSFPCLARCGFGGFVGPVVFEHGAMPSLRTLHVQFAVREAREIPSSDGGFGMGLGNLPSLQDV